MAERPRADVHRNPFPGLRPFRPDEARLFFGRESQVDRMVDKLAVRRFLAVVGSSASGKSSLVNCGLRPALHRGFMARAGASWRMAQFRPGDDPIGAMARALACPGILFDADAGGGMPMDQLVEATLRLSSLGLVDIVEQARLGAGQNLLVVVDQFEELFRFRALSRTASKHAYGPAEDAVAFVKMLLEAVAQSDLAIYVVLTMRSDFLGDCSQFQGLPEAINEGQYLVPRLTREEIRAAITGPASVAGAEIGPVLLTRLLNDVGDNPDQLSILQHALNRTWARWENEGKGQGALDIAQYEAIGGMRHALDQHAEKAYGELADVRRQRICEGVFKALTDKVSDPRGIRRPTRLSSLCAITGSAEDEVLAVIDIFRKPSRSFLMPPLGETQTADPVIDISHETLMRVWTRLMDWADDEANSARVYRRLSETAALYDSNAAGLWRDPDLRLALDWRKRSAPTSAWSEKYGGTFDSAMRFLDRSRDAQSAQAIDAEIERRWLARWSYLPLVLVAVPFVFLQPTIADGLGRLLAQTPRARSYAGWLSHLLAGAPAALGYMLLARYGKKRFRRVMLESMRGQAGAGADIEEVLERATDVKPASAVEVHATEYATFGRRTAAHLADWAACLILAFIITFLLAFLLAMANALPDPSNQDDGLLVPALMWYATFWLYRALTLASRRQATPGMRLAGIFVSELHGRPVGFLRATARHLAAFLSYYTLFYGFLMQPFNDRRQTLHDRLSGTVVLRRPPKP